MYFKIEKDSAIIGIATSADLLRCGNSGNILTANEQNAQFIQCGTTAYHADWMRKCIAQGTIEDAEVSEITEEEYNEYLSAVEAGEELTQTIAEEEAVTEETSDVADTDVGNSEEPTSYTLPSYSDLVKIVSNVVKRLAALEG